MTENVAVVTGFGSGLSEDLTLKLVGLGYKVAGLSRSGKSGGVVSGDASGFHAYSCDITDADRVRDIFDQIRADIGNPTLLIHNAALFMREDFLATKPADFEQLWRTMCLGAVHVAQEVLPNMIDKGAGKLIFSGATASVKAGAQSAAFSSAKFALRGLVQSLARAYGPKGVHVAHVVIDGVIWGERAQGFGLTPEDCMKAQDISDSYLALIDQKPSAWTHEVDLRPYKESF